jgi:glutamate/tyrosine decarboxylase-like PLP-dependent enzyme
VSISLSVSTTCTPNHYVSTNVLLDVDGASGAFVAPFTNAKAGGTKWNFELPRVKSINVSGHKFGLVYAGVGWIIWRDESYLPKHLVFELVSMIRFFSDEHN